MKKKIKIIYDYQIESDDNYEDWVGSFDFAFLAVEKLLKHNPSFIKVREYTRNKRTNEDIVEEKLVFFYSRKNLHIADYFS